MESIEKLFEDKFLKQEKSNIIETLFKLNEYFILSVVIDIWAPKDANALASFENLLKFTKEIIATNHST